LQSTDLGAYENGVLKKSRKFVCPRKLIISQ